MSTSQNNSGKIITAMSRTSRIKTYGQKFRNSRKFQLLSFAAAFVVIGVIALIFSSAATPTIISEPENGTVAGTATIFNDASASAGRAVRFGSAVTNITKIRAAFYYPWFPEAWNQQGFNPYTNYNPSLGNYSSTDTTVINKHIDELIYAGMNSAIYSWWGQGSKEDTRFASFLSATGSKALKWAIYYECEGNASGGTCGSIGGPSPSVANIQSDLSYIKTKYASDSHYLVFNGKPVIFVYGDGTDSCTTSANWKTANTNLGSPFYIVLKVFSGYAGCASQPDNWHQYGPAAAEDLQAGHSITISPGFWQKGHPNGGGDGWPFLARSLTRWQTNVNDIKNSTLPIQLVTTFNEWGEGSSIESADEWATTSGHGSYIDILHDTLVGTGTDSQAPSAPTGLSATATSSSNVNLHWTASTDDVGVTGYEITRNGVVQTTIPPATTYSDATVVANTAYSYTLKALDAAGHKSAASNTATATTPASADTTPPTTPSNFAASLIAPSGSAVHLSWGTSTDTGGSGLKNYVISRNGSVISSPSFSATSFNDTTSIFATNYTYTITAVDNANNTSGTATATITTPTAPPDTAAPDVPTANTSVVSPTQVTISWNTVADNPKIGGASGVKGYRIFRDGSQVADVSAPSNSTNDGPFNFVSGQAYKYTVLAYDVAGNASAQSPVSSVTPNPVVSSGNNCGNAPTGNKINTVIVIAEENRSWSSVGGVGFSATQMPNIHALATKCAFFQNDTEVNTSENSATQYVGAWTGFDSNVTHVASDCHPSSSCSYTGNNIFRAFRNAGIPHREYVEGPTTTCSFSGNADKHVPELYMFDTTDKAACNSEVLPITQLNFANPPTGFSFITPNLCNDGHDCTGSSGNTVVDNWLFAPSRLPALFNSAAYKSGKVLVEVWWDEDHPKPNLFACWSCKQLNSATDPHYSGESLLWLNLLGAPTTNLGGITTGLDIRSIIGTP